MLRMAAAMMANVVIANVLIANVLGWARNNQVERMSSAAFFFGDLLRKRGTQHPRVGILLAERVRADGGPATAA